MGGQLSDPCRRKAYFHARWCFLSSARSIGGRTKDLSDDIEFLSKRIIGSHTRGAYDHNGVLYCPVCTNGHETAAIREKNIRRNPASGAGHGSHQSAQTVCKRFSAQFFPVCVTKAAPGSCRCSVFRNRAKHGSSNSGTERKIPAARRHCNQCCVRTKDCIFSSLDEMCCITGWI